jgi:hypothetical protein
MGMGAIGCDGLGLPYSDLQSATPEPGVESFLSLR